MLPQLLETLGVGTVVIRASDGRVLDANAAQARILGRAPEELVGRTATEIGLAAGTSALERLEAVAREREARGGPTAPTEAVVRTRAGTDRTVDLAVERTEVGGEACLAIAMHVVDRDERGVAEQALRASEQRYRGIVESASDGVWMLDEVDRISFVNRAMARMLGYEVHELLGRRAAAFIVDDSEPVGRRALRQRREGGAHRYDVHMRRKDGSDLFVEMSATPLEGPDGRYGGAVSMVADMTGRRAAQVERERLEARLAQAQRLETVGQLAGGIAHDFNNLLAVILNYTYFVREQLPEDSAQRADIDEIRHAAERASELTHQLLVFSRRENVETVVLDLNEVVRDVERLLGRTLGPQFSLTTELAPDRCLVEADPAQLEQVVLNLVVNARDALPGGGEIRVATRRPDPGAAGADAAGSSSAEQVVLSVSDEGEGMEPEVQARAFEPFFTTKPKGVGTGLGLATVYGTVTQSGGTVEIDSVPGGGTTVRVCLPAVTAPRAEPEEQAAADGDAHGATVLLVDDEDAVRALTGRILSGGGFECLEASGGEEALRLYELNRERIDLLLTDVVMPEMSGKELADRIAGGGPGPPVVFMSGYAEDTVPQALPGAAGALLQKPFTNDSLLQAVRDALG